MIIGSASGSGWRLKGCSTHINHPLTRRTGRKKKKTTKKRRGGAHVSPSSVDYVSNGPNQCFEAHPFALSNERLTTERGKLSKVS